MQGESGGLEFHLLPFGKLTPSAERRSLLLKNHCLSWPAMAKSRSTRQLWRQTESGLILSAGRLTDSADASSETYLKIKQKALDVEKLYADSRVPLPDNSDLAQLIAEAKSLSDLWLMGQKGDRFVSGLSPYFLGGWTPSQGWKSPERNSPEERGSPSRTKKGW